MKAVVTGVIATFPVGGVAWDYAQYAVALERLGYEVYYLEDSGLACYDAERREYSADCSYGVAFLQDALSRLSPTLGRRWHYRAMDDTVHGVDTATIRRVTAEADLFLNISGACLLREEYLASPRKVLVDTDPGWNHFVQYPRQDTWTDSSFGTFRDHDHYFTYATRLGTPGCLLPDLGLSWTATVPPVVTDLWRTDARGERWTTVMTWDNYGKPVEHDGRTYGSKEPEFAKVEHLPRSLSTELEVAVGGVGAPVERWKSLDWHVVDSTAISRTVDDYRAYIQRSRGEFSVAKNIYVDTQSGWFSCRSVCYLAAGRPAVVQDTGFTSTLDTEGGVFAFTTADEAEDRIRRVEADYRRHAEAARATAETVFEGTAVVKDMLTAIGAA